MTNKRGFLLAGLVVPVAALLSLAVRQADAAPAPPAVAKTIAADVAAYQAANKTPGVVVAVYDPKQFGTNGAVYAFGVTSFRGTKKADANTVFQIGSITKVFDGTLLGDVIARGYASASTTAYNAMKSPKSLAKATTFKSITLQELVTHSAGFPDTVQSGDGDNLFADNPTPPADLVTFWLHDTKKPGCYSYSDAGFVTLGYALVDLWKGANSGKYSKILASEITEPLGMRCTSTTVASGCTAATGANLAGTPKAVTGTASDIKSTGNDMLKFLEANLGIGPVTADATLRTAIASAQKPVNTFQDCAGGGSIKLGFAWQEAAGSGGATVLSKDGATPKGGQSADLQMVPSTHVGVVVLTNGISGKPGPIALASQLLAALQRADAAGPASPVASPAPKRKHKKKPA
jgi:beta-lactamase class C